MSHVKMSHVFKDWLLRRSAESETREDAFWWHPCSLQYGLPISSSCFCRGRCSLEQNSRTPMQLSWCLTPKESNGKDWRSRAALTDGVWTPSTLAKAKTALICLFIVSLEQLPMCIPFGWGFYPKFTVGLHRRRTILLRLETIQYHSICLWMIEIFISIFRYFLTRRFKKSEPTEWTGMLLGSECIDEKLARSRSHLSSC